jgi:hypothetical protein
MHWNLIVVHFGVTVMLTLVSVLPSVNEVLVTTLDVGHHILLAVMFIVEFVRHYWPK